MGLYTCNALYSADLDVDHGRASIPAQTTQFGTAPDRRRSDQVADHNGGYRAAAAASDYDTLLPPIRRVSALPNRSVSPRDPEPTLPRPD